MATQTHVGQNKNKKDEKLILLLEEREKQRRLQWSVYVRYIVIVVIVAISLMGAQFQLNYDLRGIFLAVALAFIFNIASSFVYRSTRYPEFWPYLGIFFDMIVITIVVHFTGGIESVFLPLYLLQLVGTNLHFSKIAGPLNFIFGGNLFIFLVLLEQAGVIPHYATGFFPPDAYQNPQFILMVSITLIALMGISTYRSGHVVWSLQSVERKLFELNEDLSRMNQALAEANKRLSDADQIKTEFISVASHQMRTPLSAIKWSLKMVMDGDMGQLSPEQKDVLRKGYMSNERMIGLINDLLNVSRIEEGRFQYQFQPTQLEEVVDHALEELRSEIETRKIQFSYAPPRERFPPLNLDEQKIKLALQNVLDNAFKYTQKGGKVWLSLDREDGQLHIRVRDSGVGIPQHQQHRIFSKFFRADNVIRMQTEGSGLGLFIVKKIIEHHGGRVWFESREEHGTTVHMTIPLVFKPSTAQTRL